MNKQGTPATERAIDPRRQAMLDLTAAGCTCVSCVQARNKLIAELGDVGTLLLRIAYVREHETEKWAQVKTLLALE